MYEREMFNGNGWNKFEMIEKKYNLNQYKKTHAIDLCPDKYMIDQFFAKIID